MSFAVVTGATGFIGSYLVEELIKNNLKLRCLVRKTSDIQHLKNKPVEIYCTDFLDPASLEKAVNEAAFVFHVAGVVKARSFEEYMQGNWLVTKNIIEACYRSCKDLQRFIHISSLAAVGPSENATPVDEQTPCRPVSPYGISKYKAEQEVLKYLDKLPITIIRPPVVYGARDRNLEFYLKIAEKRVQLILGTKKLLSLIYVEDLVKGIALSAFSPVAKGQIYFLTDQRPYSYHEISSTLSRVMGQKFTVKVTIHDGIVKFLAGVMEDSLKIFNKAHIFNRSKAREILYQYWICSGKKAEKELGFVARTPLEEGFRLTVQEHLNRR